MPTAREVALDVFGDDLPSAIDLVVDLEDDLAALRADQIRYRVSGRLVRADYHVRALKRFLRTGPSDAWRILARNALERLSSKPRYAEERS